MTSAPIDQTYLPIYPSYCHDRSPTFHKWCPMLASDVVALREVDGFNGQDIYFHLNHPIKYVKLTGIVVVIDEFPGVNGGRVVITIDDSSGVNIECTCAAPPKEALPSLLDKLDEPTVVTKVQSKTWEVLDRKDGKAMETFEEGQSPDGPNLIGIDVGIVVKIKGALGVFRGTKQIRLKRIEVLRDTNKEVLSWREMVKFYMEVLSRPWVVDEEEERNCRVKQQEEEELWKKQEEEDKRLRREEGKMRKRQEEKNRRRQERLMDVRNQKGGEKKNERGRDQKHSKREGLDLENKATYPSRAARECAAGKYAALGI